MFPVSCHFHILEEMVALEKISSDNTMTIKFEGIEFDSVDQNFNDNIWNILKKQIKINKEVLDA